MGSSVDERRQAVQFRSTLLLLLSLLLSLRLVNLVAPIHVSSKLVHRHVALRRLYQSRVRSGSQVCAHTPSQISILYVLVWDHHLTRTKLEHPWLHWRVFLLSIGLGLSLSRLERRILSKVNNLAISLDLDVRDIKFVMIVFRVTIFDVQDLLEVTE